MLLNQTHANVSFKRFEGFEEISKSSGYILDCSGKTSTLPKLASELRLPASTILKVSFVFLFLSLVIDWDVLVR